jgi:hypothetical protein
MHEVLFVCKYALEGCKMPRMLKEEDVTPDSLVCYLGPHSAHLWLVSSLPRSH